MQAPVNGAASELNDCPEIGAHHCSTCNNHYELGKNTPKCYPKIYNSCSPSPCENQGSCRYLSSDYVECDCKLGFTGPFCDKVNHCYVSDPCLNEGVCKLDYSTERGYICSCFDGFEGQNCEIDLNDPCGCPNGVPKRPCLGDFGSTAAIQCEAQCGRGQIREIGFRGPNRSETSEIRLKTDFLTFQK